MGKQTMYGCDVCDRRQEGKRFTAPPGWLEIKTTFQACTRAGSDTTQSEFILETTTRLLCPSCRDDGPAESLLYRVVAGACNVTALVAVRNACAAPKEPASAVGEHAP